jgi:hypothetical protein
MGFLLLPELLFNQARANLVWPRNGDLVASTAKSKGISLIAPRRSTMFAATNCSYRGCIAAHHARLKPLQRFVRINFLIAVLSASRHHWAAARH